MLLFLGHYVISIIVEMLWFEFIVLIYPCSQSCAALSWSLIISIVVEMCGLSSLCEYIHAHKAVLLFLGHFFISIVVEMLWFEFIM